MLTDEIRQVILGRKQELESLPRSELKRRLTELNRHASTDGTNARLVRAILHHQFGVAPIAAYEKEAKQC